MRVVKLMADYGCFPLWEASPDALGNIDPDTLPISVGLKSRLIDWATQYDATLNSEDPLQSGFQTEEQERKFESVGHQLCEALQKELGPNFEVILRI